MSKSTEVKKKFFNVDQWAKKFYPKTTLPEVKHGLSEYAVVCQISRKRGKVYSFRPISKAV